MTPVDMTVSTGGTPTAEQAAVLVAAAEAVLASEAAPADPTPTAYRSPWRAAAIREGLRQEIPPPVRR